MQRDRRVAPSAFAIVGLGQMGGSLARQALGKGFRIVGADAAAVSDDLVSAGLVPAPSLADIVRELPPPRIIFIYVPAGGAVDSVLDQLGRHLSAGDVAVDGGNSYWGDSIRRQRRLAEGGIGFVDLGTSGGISGARHGACFMAGGERRAVSLVEPILQSLAVEGGYVHAGGPGAGHFVKLVHNGIEFGMMQAIGEGLALLERYPEEIRIGGVLQAWRHGSVVRSWLVDLLAEAYGAGDRLETVPPYLEDTGEVNWLVEDAMRFEVPIPVIAQSVMQLLASRDDSRNWSRAIAMMRHGFGGHPFGPEPAVARKRSTSRVGGFVSPATARAGRQERRR